MKQANGENEGDEIVKEELLEMLRDNTDTSANNFTNEGNFYNRVLQSWLLFRILILHDLKIQCDTLFYLIFYDVSC